MGVEPPSGGDGVEVEPGEDQGMIPVLGVIVPLGVHVFLPATEVCQEQVDVMWPMQSDGVFVQDFQPLENELDVHAKTPVAV